MRHLLAGCIAAASAMGAFAAPVQSTGEFLTREAVAVNTDGGVFISWRSLITDGADLGFDIYRYGEKITTSPITDVTNYTDAHGKAGDTYEVKAVGTGALAGTENSTCTAWADPYMKVHLQRPEAGVIEFDNSEGHKKFSYTYTPDDLSVGDVDGDGVLEIFVKWMPSNAKDSSGTGFTGPTLIDCYRLDGTLLWRVDLGHNIRSGNHYTQFLVYDFDGDGKAELICKTAPGTKDGKGNWVLLDGDKETDDYRQYENSPSKIFGHVKGGAEYLTVFSGLTGEEIHTIPYRANYTIVDESTWGDDYCNRADRYLACVAHLHGNNHSAVMARGYYRCAFVWAVDFDGKELKEVWFHESKTKDQGLWGEGAHSITVGDVDADGYDEIVYGAASLDNDGSLLYRTNPKSLEGHGDALHLAKMLPDREGLQVFMPHEEDNKAYPYDTELRDARTGEIIFFKPQSGKDIGRGIAANVSPSFPGYEYWAASDANVYSYGKAIATNRPAINFRIYWDGDLLDELLDGTWITKPEADFSKINTLVDFAKYSNASSCNGTKATPNLQADIMGDWREEVIMHDASTESDLLIFTTTIPTSYKLPCLLQDHQYRMAIAWQNCGYNQPPHLSYSPEDTYETAGAILISEGSAAQMVALGEPIETTRMRAWRATGLKISELPAGLSWEFDETTLTGTLSGTPTEPGDYDITVTTTGAKDDNNTSMTIKLKVNKIIKLTPLASYTFDNAGATAKNLVEGEATAIGGTPEAVAGKKGGAVLLDGKTYYKQAAYDKLNLGLEDFTIELWMKSKDTEAYLFTLGSHAKDEAAGTSGNWVGLELKNGVLYFAIDDDLAKKQAYVKEAAKWFDDEWHHVVMVRDVFSSKLILYVDGVAVAEGQDGAGAISCPGEALIIGNTEEGFADSFYSGAIDEFVIYSGAMPAEKVAERYASTGKELAYYPLDEIGETTPNLTYGEAVATGGTPLAVADGMKGGAVEFADGAHYIQEAYDAVQLGDSDFTVELWIKSTDNDGYVFFKGSHTANEMNGTTGHWIGLERHSSGALLFTIDDNVNKTDCKLANANSYFDNQWHHVACVRSYEAKTMKLYIDGVERASATGVKTGALLDNMEPLRLGISDEAARPYDGMMDEFVIHPKAMTAEEVKDAYLSLAGSGIDEILATEADAVYTVVDAFSGMIMRRAEGHSAASVTAGLVPGIYVLVVESPRGMETYKFVKRD